MKDDTYYDAPVTVEPTISDTIRNRIIMAGAEFQAADNISEFIQDGEIPLLINELTTKFEGVLDTLLIDRVNDPNSADTPRRLAKMYVHELLSGRYYPGPNVTAFPNTDPKRRFLGMLVIRSDVISMCSHHHQTVKGTCYIGIMPKNEVIGLSKYSRIVEFLSRRPTLQEELTKAVLDKIIEETGSPDVGVHIVATHGCCENRGIRTANSRTSTTTLSGQFFKHDIKQEFFENIKMQEQSIR